MQVCMQASLPSVKNLYGMLCLHKSMWLWISEISWFVNKTNGTVSSSLSISVLCSWAWNGRTRSRGFQNRQSANHYKLVHHVKVQCHATWHTHALLLITRSLSAERPLNPTSIIHSPLCGISVFGMSHFKAEHVPDLLSGTFSWCGQSCELVCRLRDCVLTSASVCLQSFARGAVEDVLETFLGILGDDTPNYHAITGPFMREEQHVLATNQAARAPTQDSNSFYLCPPELSW